MGSSMAYGDNSCPQCGAKCGDVWTTGPYNIVSSDTVQWVTQLRVDHDLRDMYQHHFICKWCCCGTNTVQTQIFRLMTTFLFYCETDSYK